QRHLRLRQRAVLARAAHDEAVRDPPVAQQREHLARVRRAGRAAQAQRCGGGRHGVLRVVSAELWHNHCHYFNRSPRVATIPSYRVYGMSQSFFTRKLEGALAYKGIPYRLRRFAGACPPARAAGWPGGIPVVETSDGEWTWDTTELLHHLEHRFPEPALLPPDLVARFLDAALEDFADEWLYRPAVGSRWWFEENARVGGFELARDATHEAPVSA